MGSEVKMNWSRESENYNQAIVCEKKNLFSIKQTNS